MTQTRCRDHHLSSPSPSPCSPPSNFILRPAFLILFLISFSLYFLPLILLSFSFSFISFFSFFYFSFIFIFFFFSTVSLFHFSPNIYFLFYLFQYSKQLIVFMCIFYLCIITPLSLGIFLFTSLSSFMLDYIRSYAFVSLFNRLPLSLSYIYSVFSLTHSLSLSLPFDRNEQIHPSFYCLLID